MVRKIFATLTGEPNAYEFNETDEEGQRCGKTGIFMYEKKHNSIHKSSFFPILEYFFLSTLCSLKKPKREPKFEPPTDIEQEIKFKFKRRRSHLP